jgi:hypothetical protein
MSWRKLTPRWIEILSDDVTPELAAVVQRISGLPIDERKTQSKDKRLYELDDGLPPIEMTRLLSPALWT